MAGRRRPVISGVEHQHRGAPPDVWLFTPGRSPCRSTGSEPPPAASGCFQRAAEVEAPRHPEVSGGREAAARPCDWCPASTPGRLRLFVVMLMAAETFPTSAAVDWFVWSCCRGDGCIKVINTGFRHEKHGRVNIESFPLR